MLVKYWMNKEVITVEADASMQEADKKMRHYAVGFLPVMTKGKLVGVITDRDLSRASASKAKSLKPNELVYLLSGVRVGDIMTPAPITVRPDHTLEETAAQLLMNDISGAPVVDSAGHIVGTISQRELLLALTFLSGYGKQGLQLALQIEDRPGTIKEVTDVIRQYNGRLVSVLSSASRAPVGQRYLYIRTYDIDREQLPRLLEHLGSVATLLYMVDHRENKRVEFKKRREAA